MSLLENCTFNMMTEDTDPQLLKIAIDNGFDRQTNPYNNLFQELFFNGGQLLYKDDLDPEFKTKVFKYLNMYMRGFSSSHEDKAAVSALLLSEIIDLEKYNENKS